MGKSKWSVLKEFVCAEHDAMSYLEERRSRCELSNNFSVKCFSHLTIVKISEFSHSPLGGSKALQKCYDEKGKGERRERDSPKNNK